jgi:hypothetical protein
MNLVAKIKQLQREIDAIKAHIGVKEVNEPVIIAPAEPKRRGRPPKKP